MQLFSKTAKSARRLASGACCVIVKMGVLYSSVVLLVGNCPGALCASDYAWLQSRMNQEKASAAFAFHP